ncbi:MAG TPA: class I SAM-dependent methyltransferase [Bryobacteraceae bacterium]|nr:class I SAM-dependent methyltransferase [Bryobacteraceae bacterium]
MNCDRIARAYRWLEYLGFGRELERRRFRHLPYVAAARRALVLGGGDGRFLARFLLLHPQARADYVDCSPRMLRLARARAGAGRVRYLLSDARSLSLPPETFDLIVTNFFLDCFDQADALRVVERAARAAKPRAQWLVAEFRPVPWAGPLLAALYLFFRLAAGLKTRRLVDHHALLARHGFRLEREERSWFGWLTSELWSRAPQQPGLSLGRPTLETGPGARRGSGT